MHAFHLNGKPCTVDADSAVPLLAVLRDDQSLSGPKFGCGQGECGACMVLVDGQPHTLTVGTSARGVTLKRLEHPPAVGVVADEVAIDAVDCVDRAGHLGGRGNLVAQLQHRRLVRHRDIEADELQ